MSGSSKSDSGNAIDVEELLQIGTRCRELRKEKDILRKSQSQSFELVRRLGLHVKSLSEAHTEDEKQIQKLERELMNCSQEIDYLQDQLNSRNTEVHSLSENLHILELKLADMDYLQEEVAQLREELRRSHYEGLLLIHELEIKELELQKSALCIEKLEESISTAALESQCEIESMKLDMMALEQSYSEAKKIQEENTKEKNKMNELIQELEVRIHGAQEIIESLDEENKDLKEKLVKSETNAGIFCQKFEKWLENKHCSELTVCSFFKIIEGKLTISEELSEEAVDAFLSKLALQLGPEDLKEKMESMSHQIHEYELLVEQLKEELREEKMRAKEEAEDLAQEMAELRYQMTGLLEEECKRRACIEQASLQRIAALEAQIQKEQGKSSAIVRHLEA